MQNAVTPSASNLSTPYAPVAVYYADADSVEYVRRDAPAVYRRVDELLTLVVAMDNRDELLGFQLKGFRAFYLQDAVRAQLGDDFLSLVGILERAVTVAGHEVCDAHRKHAYESARRIALEDGVALHDFPKVAAHA